jgi:hypothetical protein
MLTNVVKPAYKSLFSTLFLSSPPTPRVIIVGNQKSGTTAIAALLAKYIGQAVTLDITALWGENERRIHDGEKSLMDFALAHKYDFSRPVVKEPCLTFLLPQVRATFPTAKVIFIVRDPRDNIRSILNRLKLPGNQQQLPMETYQRMPNGWEYVLDGTWMGLEGTSYIDMLAARWERAVALFFEHQAEAILVQYEAFATDKVATISRLAIDLGIAQQCDITKFLQVQFQPKGNPSVDWNKFFGAENLAIINGRCADTMVRLGYQL